MKPFDLLERKYELVMADWNDNLNEFTEEIEKVIRKQSWESLDELTWDWYLESYDYGIDYVLEEFKRNLIYNFDITEKVAERYIEMYRDELIEEIYNRDCSTYLDDLIRHTDDLICYYHLGFDINSSCNSSEIKYNIKEIKRALGIKIHDTTYDKKLMELTINAPYGGMLVVHFMYPVKELINLGNPKEIYFENPMVTVLDLINGSGYNMDFPGIKISRKFNMEDLLIEKNVHWNYTYQICGMVENWCDCTKVTFK
jgi:hypothetical protein